MVAASPPFASIHMLSEAIERLERLVAPAVLWEDVEMHGYEPFDADMFAACLEAAVAASAGSRFLEVGCGIGTKLVIAKGFGLDVTGLEIRPVYAAIARELCPEAAVIVGDARGFDAYGDFDIVYSYKPLLNEDAQQELERRMSGLMGADAIWVNARRDTAWLGWEPVTDHVWRRV